jgi:hypothetical protein
MPITWDETRVATLSNQDLLQLRDNALRKANADVGGLCDAEISKRGVGVKPKRVVGAAADPMRAREKEVSEDIGAFAQGLAAIYDLSPEAAVAKSKSSPRFIPHKLTQSNGTAKLGGLQRAGKCRIDRYVSYRVKDSVVSLHAFLARNAPDDALEFQVFGPAADIDGGQTIRELRAGLAEEKESKLFAWGKRFSDLAEAKACFEKTIAKSASLRKDG